MKLAYIDKDLSRWESFRKITKKVEEVKECIFCTYENMNLDCTDIVFIHISSDYDNIREFFEKAKQKNELCEVVFIADNRDFKIKAFEVDALGYITAPLNEGSIENVINKVQKLHGKKENKPIIRTFGNFDIFLEDKAIMFSNKKAKELLALLVDKCGGSLNMEQIIDVLWEDRPFDENTKSLYRIALKNLRDTLKKAGCPEILIEKRGQRSIDVNRVSCDFYELINGKKTAFSGEYMTNYSWGEYTLAKLFEKYC